MRRLRGAAIGMVFQEPMTALNPLRRAGDQIAETFRIHTKLGAREIREKTLALLTEVRMPDPVAALRAYPHELSGGQRQRVMIAMALALEPALLIADEPTTALDVTTQGRILALIRDIQRRRGMGVLFITHDFGVVAATGAGEFGLDERLDAEADAVDLAPRVRVRLDGGLGLEMVVAEVERGALRHPQVGFTVGGVHVWWLRSATAIVAFET
mgnify:CR=1 FL=1